MKKILSIASLVMIATPFFLTSCVNEKKNVDNNKYSINGNVLKGEKELIDFLNENVKPELKDEFQEIYYIDKEKKYFSNMNSLKKYISSYIGEESFNFNNKQKVLDKIHKNNNLITDEIINESINFGSNVSVFRGKNNVAYTNMYDAKMSYFNINKVYKFADKTFEFEEDLIKYIKNDFAIEMNTKNLSDVQKNEFIKKYFKAKKYTSVYKLPSRYILDLTPSIKVVDSTTNQEHSEISEAELKSIKEILKNESIPYILSKNNNKIINLLDHVNESEFVNSKLFKLLTLNIKSNQNRKTITVDTDKNEPYSLFGRYHLETSSNQVFSISDPKNWTKSNKNTNLVQKNISTKRNIVNKFISNLIYSVNIFDYEKANNKDPELVKKYDKNDLKSESIFKIFSLSKETENLKKNLKNIIVNKQDNLTLWDKVQEIVKININGKRGNILNQIFSSYLSIVTNLGEQEVDIKTVLSFKVFYNKLFKLIDNNLRDCITDEFYIDEKGEKMNLFKILGLDSFNIPNNINFDSLVDTFANSNTLVNAMSVITHAQNNSIISNGIIDYNKEMLYDKDDKKNYNSLYDKYSLNSKKIESLTTTNSNSEIIFKFNHSSDSNYLNAHQHNLIQTIKEFNTNLSKYTVENLRILKKIGGTATSLAKTNNINLYNLAFERMIKSNNISEQTKKELESAKIPTTTKIDRLIEFYTKEENQAYIKKNLTNEEYFVSLATNKLDISQQIDKYQKIEIMNRKFATIANSIDFTVSIYTSLFELYNDVYNQGKNSLNVLKTVFNGILSFAPQTPYTMMFAFGLNMIFDITSQFIGTKYQTDYIFSDTGANEVYVWDGGLSETKFWGFVNNEIKTVKDAKILKPVEISPGISNSYYLFNGKKYSDTSNKKLYHDFLKYITSYPETAKILFDDSLLVYSLVNSNDLQSDIENSHYTLISDNIDKMTYSDILKYLEPYLIKNYYIVNDVPIYSNVSDEKYFEKLANAFGNSKFNPTFIVQIPELFNKKPIDQKDDKILSMDEIYSTFDEIKKNIVSNFNPNRDKYISIDRNIVASNISNFELLINSDQEAIEILKQTFFSSFHVDHKRVEKIIFLKNNKYSDLSSSEEIYLYWIYSDDLLKKYFLTYDDAFNTLMNGKNFLNVEKRKIVDSKTNFYEFDEQTFISFDDLVKYCKKKYYTPNN
ncbi:hypothetical protein [Mycoplasma crocodyli]|uniref:Putative lipoprotein n=1 Tax=Mycoplasma crocodyli (strain ATCC 51981 / MP145) TaxID=512564 RepID=D5E5A0_MYCCM|nr:hypothetical protein [Mycoplasma crocodyli]ADE19880.1 putative lipoprotein [Mycoplasma crocodyli MP145]